MSVVATRERMVRFWDRLAPTYDRKVAAVERRYLAESRSWVGRRAAGATLEIAVGTGLNLPYYDDGVTLTGVDWSERMLAVARRRADSLSRPVALQRADAAALPFDAGRFDSVVCTFGLCCVPDERAALSEALRVLRPGGSLLLADHIVSSNVLIRGLQHAVEAVTGRLQGEYFTRRPLTVVADLGLAVVDTQRLTHGAIERVHARKPT